MAERLVDAVIFDYGGVITQPLRTFTNEWLASDGVDSASFAAAMRDWLGQDAPLGTPVHLLETGQLPPEEFERLLAARLRTVTGSPLVAEGLLDRLFGQMRPTPAMLGLIRELREAGVAVALLSNSWGNHYPDEIRRLCAPVVISGEVGLRKPDPRIYRLVLSGLGLDPQRCAFVDDAPVNVAAATALGIRAVRHTAVDATRSALAEWLPELGGPGR